MTDFTLYGNHDLCPACEEARRVYWPAFERRVNRLATSAIMGLDGAGGATAANGQLPP